MGNQFASKCCNTSILSTTQVNDIEPVSKSTLKHLNSPPKLNQRITALLKQKPFEAQFQSQQNMLIVKTNEDIVYHGLIDSDKLPHGYGKVYRENGTLMVGRFEHGLRVRLHYLFLPDGSYFKGIMEDDAIVQGEYQGQEGFKYVGQFKNYQMHGKGSQSHPTYQFEGEYQMGRRAKGLLKWEENNFVNTYYGTFDENQLFHGFGELTTPQGTYKGEFKKGQKEGEGIFQFRNGLTYKGEYLNGEKNGVGCIINSNGSISYEGQFLNGLPHGKGKSLSQNGKMRQGIFEYGIASEYYNRLAQYRSTQPPSNF